MPERVGHGKNLTIIAALVGAIAVVMIGIAVVIAIGQDDDVDIDVPSPGTAANGVEDDGSTDVAMTLRAEVSGSRLMVEGDITVPDGAIVKYEITGPEDCDECRAEGRVPVSNQSFRVSYDISNWPDDTFRVRAAFQTILEDAEQPRHVIERYGELGERITGDTVDADGYSRVEAETTVSP